MGLVSSLVVTVDTGEASSEVNGVLQVLCFAPLIDPFSRFGGELMATRHKDRIWIVATAATLVSFLTAGLVLTSLYGPIGMAWANYLPLGGLVMALAVARLAPEGFRGLVSDLGWIYLLPLPFFAAALAIPADHPWLRIAASFGALAITAILYWRRFGTSFRNFFRGPAESAPTVD